MRTLKRPLLSLIASGLLFTTLPTQSIAQSSCIALLANSSPIYESFETEVLRVVDEVPGEFGTRFLVSRVSDSGWADSRQVFKPGRIDSGDISWDLREFKYTLGEDVSSFWGFDNFASDRSSLTANDENAILVDYVSVPSVEHLNGATDFFNSNLVESRDLEIPLRYYWIDGAFTGSYSYLWRFAFEASLPISNYHRQFYHDISGHSLQGLLSHSLLIQNLREQVKIVFDLRQAWFEFTQIIELIKTEHINPEEITNSEDPLLKFAADKGIELKKFSFGQGVELESSTFFKKITFQEYMLARGYDLEDILLSDLQEIQTTVKNINAQFYKVASKIISLIDNWGNLYILFTDLNSMKTITLVGQELDRTATNKPHSTDTGLRGIVSKSSSSFSDFLTRFSERRPYPKSIEMFPRELSLRVYSDSIAISSPDELEELWKDFGQVLYSFDEIANSVVRGGQPTEEEWNEYQKLLRDSQFFSQAHRRLAIIREAQASRNQ